MKIAFAGAMRAGKDTCVNYLIEKYGGVNLKFATPLYDIMHYAQDRCGLPHTKWRRFLQILGTELFREEYPGIWIRLLLEEAEGAKSHCFVSDLRFADEADALRAAGFTLVLLQRPEETRLATEGLGATDSSQHSSEMGLDGVEFDHVVWNTGGLSDLYGQLDNVASEQG